MIERGRLLQADNQRLAYAGFGVGLEHRIDRSFGILFGLLERPRRGAEETLDHVGLGLERFAVDDDAGADHVHAIVGEANRVHRLLGRVLKLDRLVHDVAQQQIGLSVHDRIELGLGVACDRLEIGWLDTSLLQEQRPDLRHRVTRSDRHGLADDVLGRADVLFGKSHHRHRRELQRDADALDRRAFGGGFDHGRHVDVAEGGGVCRDGLHRDPGAATFLDVQIDAFLIIEPALLAQKEWRVLAVQVPVEHQNDFILGLRFGNTA